MEVSDAGEIQFWPTGTDSFNEENEGYTDDYCFNQKFLCTKLRRFQGVQVGGESIDYNLILFDEDGNELANFSYVKTEVGGSDEIPEHEEDIDLPHPSLWPPAAGYSVRTLMYEFTPGRTYTITLHLEKDEPGEATNGLAIRNALTNTVIFSSSADSPPGGGTFDLSITFVANEDCDSIRWSRGGLLSDEEEGTECVSIEGSVTIPTQLPVPPDYIIYNLSLVPSENNLCDKKIRFKIFDGPDSETDTELFHSDLVDFVSEWVNGPASGRVNIQYRSIQNFAGLMYDSESPYFSIDLDGRFRKGKLITAQKTLELTEMVLNTAASVKRQIKLTLNDLPDYMHTKVSLILAHAASGSVIVNGKEISLEEGYEEGDRPETYPLTPAEIFLTEKTFYKHNVI